MAKQVAKQDDQLPAVPGIMLGNGSPIGAGKAAVSTGSRKWERRCFRPWWTRNGERHEAENYSVRISHAGRRETVALGTPDLREAGRRSARFALLLKSGGWEEAFRSLGPERAAVRAVKASASVGDWIREAERFFPGTPRTFAGNAKAFRRIVAEIAGVKDPDGKRFDYRTGGRAQWLEKVEGVPLASITPQKVEGWRADFVRRAGDNPREKQRARRNTNSLIRQSRSLFSRAVLKRTELPHPNPLPFAGVEFEPEGSLRYVATFNAAALMDAASDELRDADPECWKSLLLLLCAGLRRGELDLLCWTQLDPGAGVVRVVTNDFFTPKTATSERTVPVSEAVMRELEKRRPHATGLFVIESPNPPPLPGARDRRYRCAPVFDRLVAWLRAHGVTATKPLHELRKEFGSIVAGQADLFTASRLLGHSNMHVTQQHYAEHRARVTVDLVKPAKEAAQ